MKEESDKKRYNIYIKKDVMLSFQHYCLDVDKSVSQVLEQLILLCLKEKGKGSED